MCIKNIHFIEKEPFESKPFPSQAKGASLIPVFMVKDGDEYFVRNREPIIGDPNSHHNTHTSMKS